MDFSCQFFRRDFDVLEGINDLEAFHILEDLDTLEDLEHLNDLYALQGLGQYCRSWPF